MLYYKFSIFQKDFGNALCHSLAHMYVLNSTEMNIKLNMFFHIFVYKQIDLHDPLRAYLFLFGFFFFCLLPVVEITYQLKAIRKFYMLSAFGIFLKDKLTWVRGKAKEVMLKAIIMVY